MGLIQNGLIKKMNIKHTKTPTLIRVRRLYIDVTGLAGFEPANDGVKVRCLTAWL